jgi:hypothetical protein
MSGVFTGTSQIQALCVAEIAVVMTAIEAVALNCTAQRKSNDITTGNNTFYIKIKV